MQATSTDLPRMGLSILSPLLCNATIFAARQARPRNNLPARAARQYTVTLIMKKLLVLSCAALLCAPLSAQIAFGGEPLGTMATKLGLPDAPLVKMPEVDAAALLAEDALNEASGIKGPWRFGFNHATDLTLESSGVWHTFANGDRLWRIAIQCPGAFSINFEFNTYVIPEGAQVFVWNERGDHLGAFTAASNPGHTELGVDQLPGEKITIEYHEPAAVSGQGQLRIGQVTHAYRDTFKELKGLNDSGSCNNNVICPEGDDWRDQIASVAIILVGGSGYCTGQLLNNCNNDGTPYFLTANHCTTGQNPANWVFRFKWESPTCTPTTNGPTTNTVSGASLLVNSAGSDVALLQLNSTPPDSYGIYYSGWDATGTSPANQTCIHHPSGDIKKISFDNQSAVQAPWSGAACWHILNWDDGTTEPGSSGSGLWNQDHRLIGQLFGGTASCSNNIDDYFGRFNVSFPLLDDWLGSCGTTLDGFDPNAISVAVDASVLSIGDVDASYCDETSISPTVTIKNQGFDPLTSLTLLYNLDGGPNSTYPWTGTLATGSTATVNLGAISVGNGDHTLTVTSDDPNGGTDGNTLNDTKTRDFHVTSPAQTITLHILFDNYPEETSWQLATSGGSIVATGGPYGSQPDGSSLDIPLCVGNGCYNLTFFDGAGDGICCGYGIGNFNVSDPFGITYVSNNGQYNATVIEPFCITSTGIASSASADAMRVWPNPADASVTISLPAHTTEAVFTLNDATGRVVARYTHSSPQPLVINVAGFAEGLYTIDATIDGKRSVQRLAIRH